MPEGLSRREGRKAWLRDAKKRLDAERAEQAEPVPRDRAERLSLAQRRLVEDWQRERLAGREYEAHYERGVIERGKQAMGPGPRPHTPPARLSHRARRRALLETPVVEPVFAQIKANRRSDRFKRRGRAAASSEWRLIAATHNLLKLHRHSLAAAAA